MVSKWRASRKTSEYQYGIAAANVKFLKRFPYIQWAIIKGEYFIAYIAVRQIVVMPAWFRPQYEEALMTHVRHPGRRHQNPLMGMMRAMARKQRVSHVFALRPVDKLNKKWR